MKRYFSGITAQQAPSPRIDRQAAVWSPGRDQIAFQKPHCTRLTSALPSSAMSSSEMIEDVTEANRLARSQRTTRLPGTLRDRALLNGSGLCGASVIDVMRSALHQRDARIVPVHEQADAEADGQEHHHDERDGFDCLAGLVQRGVSD